MLAVLMFVSRRNDRRCTYWRVISLFFLNIHSPCKIRQRRQTIEYSLTELNASYGILTTSTQTNSQNAVPELHSILRTQHSDLLPRAVGHTVGVRTLRDVW